MANTLRIKRSTSTAAPASLANAELAYSESANKLFIGVGTGGANGTATSIVAIGGTGAYLTLDTTQTVSGNKTFTGDIIIPTQVSSDNSTKAASTAFVKAQNYLTGNQTITFSGDASGSGTTSVTLTLANSGITAGTYTKVTFDAKGRATSGTTLAASDIPTLTASKISDFDTQVRTSRLDQLAAAAADVSHGGFKITNVADPVDAQDAATKSYVDTTAQGLDVKGSVKAATTANITLSGAQTIDGVSLVAGDRCLVKNQTTASANGIYVVAAGSWSRSADMDVWTEVPGAFTFVEQGSTLADTGWVCTSDGGGTIGSTTVTFTQFSGAGTYTAGNGLALAGGSFSVTGTSNRISVGVSGVDIAATYVGQTSITTLGTIGTGTWNGTAITVPYGGTGATTLTGYVKGNGTSAMTASATIPSTDITGLGTMSTQASNNVAITGGSLDGVSIDNVVLDGGTF